jgi:hypothetical protein
LERNETETKTKGGEKMKQKTTKFYALLLFVLTFFCLIGCVYASNPFDIVAAGIGELVYGFFAWIIEAIVNVFFAVLDFFGNLIFGV